PDHFLAGILERRVESQGRRVLSGAATPIRRSPLDTADAADSAARSDRQYDLPADQYRAGSLLCPGHADAASQRCVVQMAATRAGSAVRGARPEVGCREIMSAT